MKLYYKRKIKSPSITFNQLKIFITFYECQLLCHQLRMYFKRGLCCDEVYRLWVENWIIKQSDKHKGSERTATCVLYEFK